MRWVRAAVTVLANATIKAFLLFALVLLFIFPSQAQDRVFASGFEPGAQGADPCDSPMVMPAGWARVARTWAQCFTPRDGSPVPTYPNSLGFPIPLGANKGEYLTCEFTAAPDQITNLFFDPAQANPGQGYYVARPAMSMFLSVSACPGDFRMRQGCALSANTGSLITTTKGQSSPTACSLTAGQRYWLTIAPVDPSDGLTPGEHTCSIAAPSSANGCDVQARQTSN